MNAKSNASVNSHMSTPIQTRKTDSRNIRCEDNIHFTKLSPKCPPFGHDETLAKVRKAPCAPKALSRT